MARTLMIEDIRGGPPRRSRLASFTKERAQGRNPLAAPPAPVLAPINEHWYATAGCAACTVVAGRFHQTVPRAARADESRHFGKVLQQAKRRK
jgi:hypothetical protein